MGKAAEDTIRQRAYKIWEKEGRPHGKHDDHWHQASTEVHGLEDLPAAQDEGRVVAPAGTKAKRAAAKPKAPAADKTPATKKK